MVQLKKKDSLKKFVNCLVKLLAIQHMSMPLKSSISCLCSTPLYDLVVDKLSSSYFRTDENKIAKIGHEILYLFSYVGSSIH